MQISVALVFAITASQEYPVCVLVVRPRYKGVYIIPLLFVAESNHIYNAYTPADVVLRLTTTDGDSVTVRESHAAGEPTLVSNVLNRPKKCNVTPLTVRVVEASLKN